jgi:hypothetical protein
MRGYGIQVCRQPVTADSGLLKRARDVSEWVAAPILILTVISAVAAGVFAAYWSINAILYAFHEAAPAETRQPRLLVPSQTHASGD